MSFAHSLNVRKFTPGPEDPSEMFAEGSAVIRSRRWVFVFIQGLAGGLSGLMFVFLAIVFIWRRPLVDRVSLRLIALISLFDLLHCILQNNPKQISMSGKRCLFFFIDFFAFGSIYLSSSIAFSLQMVFLRKSCSPLPRYTEYLYYAMPLTVCLIQFTPQYIYAATRGWAFSREGITSRTPEYLQSTLLGILFIPYVFVLYNVVTSMLVMYSLYTKQRAITRVLNSVSHEAKSLLSGSSPSTAQDSISASASRTSVSVSSKERQQLKLARSVYKVSIRITLYLIAPLFSLVIFTIYYMKQCFVTLTYRSDISDYVWLTTMGYFMFLGIAFINFVIFLTDPAVVKVIAEVRRTICIKMDRTDNFKSSSGGDNWPYSPGRVAGKKRSDTVSESGVLSETMQVDSSSLFSIYDAEKPSNNYQLGGLSGTPAALEESMPFVSAMDGLQDDAVMRRVRASGDNKSDYQDLV
ncbi:hypothetical protein GGF42_003668 [Coemansia sp. RSA 2424]|nr:hypothetical protein GGF42_003668 [Coemansia sp. RSA 2424]